MAGTFANLFKQDGRAIGIIVLIAFVLRLPYIGWGLPSETHDLNSYHPDENGVLIALSNMNPSKHDFDTKTYYWGTAYFYMCGALFKGLQLAGVLSLVSNKSYYLDHLASLDRLYIAGRLLSLTLALLSVPLMYYVGLRMFDRRTGLSAALLFAVLPVHCTRSALMLPDGTGVFFLLLSLCFFIGANDRKRIAFAGIFFGLACASKYHFGLTALFFGCCMWKEWKWANGISFVVGSLAGFVLGCPYLFPNLPALIAWLGNAGRNASAGHVAILGEYHSQVLCALNMFAFAGLAFFAAAFAVAIRALRKWDRDRLCLALPFALFALLLTFSQTRLSYYLLPAVPFAVLLVADWFSHRTKAQIRWIGLVAALSFLQSWSFAELAWRKDTRTQLSEYLVQHLPPGTRIGVTHNKYFYTPPTLMEKETRFTVEIFGSNFRDYDLPGLKERKPPYFVLSEFEWREPGVHPERAPERKQFLDYVTYSGAYVLETEIRTAPSLLGIKLPRFVPPWNERTLYPTMRLYRRV